jgi:DNA-binding transcriptional MerR regulator
MAEGIAPVEIPNRALFKSSEVCDLVKVQPYVLRSWETEFPELGVAKAAGGPRFYRRIDVEQVVRIKHLLLVEGLTLAGARRKLQEEATPIAPDAPVLDALMGQHARERLTEVKRGLQSILELLSGRTSSHDFTLTAPPAKRVDGAGRAIEGSRSAGNGASVASIARSKAAPSPDDHAATVRRKR